MDKVPQQEELNSFCRLPAVKIGAIYPLSGSQAPIGASIQRALVLAVEIINRYYDLPLPLARTQGLPNLHNRKIQIVWADSEGDPAVGRAEARRLIEEERVAALIGSYQSNVTNQASLEAEAMRVPFLNPDSSAHSLTQRGFKWFFRTSPYDTIFTELFFDFLKYIEHEGFRISPMAILSEDSMTGTEAAEVEMNFIRFYGYKLSGLEVYTPPAETLRTELNRIRKRSPHVLFGQQSLSDAILAVKTLKRLNFFPDGFLVQGAGYTAPEFIEASGADADFVISRLSWALGLGKEKPLAFEVNNLYRAKYGEDMDETNTRSFTGLLILADAINRAGSTNNYAIRDALRRTNIPGSSLIMPWRGVRFDKCGQNIFNESLLGQIQDQKFRIIWPLELAETKVIWPAPPWNQRI